MPGGNRGGGWDRWWLIAALGAAAGCSNLAPATPDLEYRVLGDAIPAPLAAAGDAGRGRAVIAGRDANCLLCHVIPESGERFMGDLGPALGGVGARLNAAQLRLRLVDQARLNPKTVMPSYYRTRGLQRVAAVYRDKPILTAQQIEDVVSFLQTLRE